MHMYDQDLLDVVNAQLDDDLLARLGYRKLETLEPQLRVPLVEPEMTHATVQ